MNDELLRILDACLNRGREALRVLEDYARFGRDDHELAGALKQQRHALQEVAAQIGVQQLLRARDVEHDVGRETRIAAELARPDARGAAQAAFGRAGESLRSLAEFAKVVDADAAQAAERIRYAVYELEQRLLLRGDLRQRMRAAQLYVIITEALCRRPWLETAEAALRGGAQALQLREKSLRECELLERARRLRELSERLGALLIINDRPDIALLAQADGVHVGQDDLPVASVRRVCGPEMLVGKSTHTIAQVDAALAERPDYVAVGPMFASSTKPQAQVAGVETLRGAASRSAGLLIAIGGITPRNVCSVREAVPACVCVCSAIVSSDDPRAATEEISRAIACLPAAQKR